MTIAECNQTNFGFEACGSREIVARFDGGTISSDGGGLLLRQIDKRLNLLPRLAHCLAIIYLTHVEFPVKMSGP